jgi:hypothetical protein
LKIKNPRYTQAEGRKELFDRWNGRMPARASCDVDFDRFSVPENAQAREPSEKA